MKEHIVKDYNTNIHSVIARIDEIKLRIPIMYWISRLHKKLTMLDLLLILLRALQKMSVIDVLSDNH
jgi:hypothetical protein